LKKKKKKMLKKSFEYKKRFKKRGNVILVSN